MMMLEGGGHVGERYDDDGGKIIMESAMEM